jgi:hypothetical protein
MTAAPLATLPPLASVDDIIATLDAIGDRASLIAFLTPLRVPHGIADADRARLTSAVIRASARCSRFPA